jgi:pimeloyl-ACP methyl ester carboxylesterase
LTGPLADEILRLSDGRILAWAEWGDPRGSPVLFLHPCPGSRLFCPDVEATAGAGVRLITVDRPGYGASDPVADPTLTGFARDLARLADHLWLGQFAVVGWAAGGPYAAACAAVLEERVSALGLVAVPAPDGQGAAVSAPGRDIAHLADLDPQLAVLAAADLAAPVAPEQVGEQWDTSLDAATRRQPEVEQALGIMWREALRRGVQGLAADVVAGARPWGFGPAQVAAAARLFYGDDDAAVGLTDARWWVQALPNASLTVLSAGHLVPVAAWSVILGALQP